METSKVKNDSIPVGYVLVHRSNLDQANADLELCDYLKEQFPTIENIRDLYKKGYRIAMKMDTINANIRQIDAEVIILTNENYKTLKKAIRKGFVARIWQRSKQPILFVGGMIFGGFITYTYTR